MRSGQLGAVDRDESWVVQQRTSGEEHTRTCGMALALRGSDGGFSPTDLRGGPLQRDQERAREQILRAPRRWGGSGITLASPHSCRRELDQPFLRPPLVLLEKHASQLGQRVGAHIVERPQDAFAIFDCERHDLAVERE